MSEGALRSNVSGSISMSPDLVEVGERLGLEHMSTVFFNSGFVCASVGSGNKSGGGTVG